MPQCDKVCHMETSEVPDSPIDLAAVQRDDDLLDRITDYDGPDMFLSILAGWARLHRRDT